MATTSDGWTLGALRPTGDSDHPATLTIHSPSGQARRIRLTDGDLDWLRAGIRQVEADRDRGLAALTEDLD